MFFFKQGPIGLDGPKGEAVSISHPDYRQAQKLQAKEKRDNVSVLYS